jgi:hypothetical protein
MAMFIGKDDRIRGYGHCPLSPARRIEQRCIRVTAPGYEGQCRRGQHGFISGYSHRAGKGNDRHRVRDGARQIEGVRDRAFASIRALSGRRSPRTGQQEPQRRGLPVAALEKSIQTHDVLYARLPASVRYRATGALTAWREFRIRTGQPRHNAASRSADKACSGLCGVHAPNVAAWD